jgi:hypothetical protein
MIVSHSSAHHYLPTFETDPFLYYSIPAVREAAFSLKEVDYSKALESAHKVTRKTRVSFENMDPILDELCGDEMDEFDDSDICRGELGDLLTTLFFKTQ